MAVLTQGFDFGASCPDVSWPSLHANDERATRAEVWKGFMWVQRYGLGLLMVDAVDVTRGFS